MRRRTHLRIARVKRAVAVVVACVLLASGGVASPASAVEKTTWTDATCPRFYDLYSSASETGVTVCRGRYATDYFLAVNVGTTVWLVEDGWPRLRWSTAATSRSAQTAILQASSPAPAFSVWFGPGDRFLFSRGFLESSWTPRPAETMGIYGVNIAAEQVAQSAVKAGVTITASQLIKNKAWRSAFSTCMTSLIGLLPDDDPSATDEAVAAYLSGTSTVLSTGGCAASLASAKQKTRLTAELKWAPVAAELARLEGKTSWVNRVAEGLARLVQAVK
ncbi:hypothetical protein [Microbacterium sp. BK668]|uniref:hypothetical protein n=1 Tax=Microbacterium sp. BK668 TaxID=2512118 RepID=UPI00105DE377|nr:hypothetical protein [Microbacterium sp. BK668]